MVNEELDRKQRKALRKEKKKHKKRRRDNAESEHATDDTKGVTARKGSKKSKKAGGSDGILPFDYQCILAPMVGASELPFRLLCRKYGTQLAYTPMMSSMRFVREPDYRREIFQTNALDRPLVCHFSANTPDDFEKAVQLVQDQCDAVDLNLGCPQRTAYVGHFGSYLLDPPDRTLICDIVRAGSLATQPPKPIFVKIRLLETLAETIELCRQLRDAGASLIAIHARPRANWERKGPGARDGPALLDQVTEIKRAVPLIPIIANGNVITYQDVVDNAALTKADGIMSAEGILDNPALFLPRWGGGSDESDATVTIADPLHYCPELEMCLPSSNDKNDDTNTSSKSLKKQKRKLLKKLREIDRIQTKLGDQGGRGVIDDDQKQKLAARETIEASIRQIEKQEGQCPGNSEMESTPPSTATLEITVETATKTTPLSQLYKSANDKVSLAQEYLRLAKHYGPTALRTQIFHVRRMMKDILNQYQLMPDCLQCTTPDQLWILVQQCRTYQNDPTLFVYDRNKAKAQAEAMERKKHEEGKRKAYEARMIRKAKREGRLEDLDHYLKLGATVPTQATVARLRSMKDKKQQLEEWKKQDHTQHCLAYHLESECQRGRACAFLHMDAVSTAKGSLEGAARNFDEQDEVAG